MRLTFRHLSKLYRNGTRALAGIDLDLGPRPARDARGLADPPSTSPSPGAGPASLGVAKKTNPRLLHSVNDNPTLAAPSSHDAGALG